MPLFKGGASKARPHKALNYILDEDKAAVHDVILMSQGRTANELGDEMEEVQKCYNKAQKFNSRKYYHFKFSPDPEDKPSVEDVQAAAMELAAQYFDGFQCVVATHVDTDVTHAHIIVNSVSIRTGKMLHFTDSEYRDLKDAANEIGKKYGMTELDWRQATAEKRAKVEAEVTKAEHWLYDRGVTTWKDDLKEIILLARDRTDNMVAFEDYLERYGVQLTRNTEKTISYRHPLREQSIRGERLGEEFTKAALERHFIELEDAPALSAKEKADHKEPATSDIYTAPKKQVSPKSHTASKALFNPLDDINSLRQLWAQTPQAELRAVLERYSAAAELRLHIDNAFVRSGRSKRSIADELKAACGAALQSGKDGDIEIFFDGRTFFGSELHLDSSDKAELAQTAARQQRQASKLTP